MKESIDYKDIKDTPSVVYVIQEIAGTREGRPKINIMGASQYGTFKFFIFSSASLIDFSKSCSVSTWSASDCMLSVFCIMFS